MSFKTEASVKQHSLQTSAFLHHKFACTPKFLEVELIPFVYLSQPSNSVQRNGIRLLSKSAHNFSAQNCRSGYGINLKKKHAAEYGNGWKERHTFQVVCLYANIFSKSP